MTPEQEERMDELKQENEELRAELKDANEEIEAKNSTINSLTRLVNDSKLLLDEVEDELSGAMNKVIEARDELKNV